MEFSVEPLETTRPANEFEAELMSLCRKRLAKHEGLRSVDFTIELPRHSAGNVYKRLLRNRHAEKTGRDDE